MDQFNRNKEAKQVLDKFLLTSLNGCKKAMRAYGMIDQMVLCITGTPVAPEQLDFRDIQFDGEEGKVALIAHLKERFKEEQAWAYLLAFETWLTETSQKKNERKEALVLAVIMPGYHRGVAAIFQRITGQEDKVVFTEEVPIEPNEPLLGQFATLLDGEEGGLTNVE